MKKNKLFTALSLVLLLSSCTYGMPRELQDYLSNCTVDKAMKWVENVKFSYESTSVSMEDETVVLGTRKTTYLASRSDVNDLYAYRVETFTGSFITTETDADGVEYNVASTAQVRYLNSTGSETTSYLAKRKVNGEDLSDVTMTYEEMNGVMLSFFYSQTQSSYCIGGMYYADTLKMSAKFHTLMSIDENGDFIYELVDVGSLDHDVLASTTNEKIVMNEHGMLESLTLEIQNYLDSNILRSSLTIEYNSSDFTRILEI